MEHTNTVASLCMHLTYFVQWMHKNVTLMWYTCKSITEITQVLPQNPNYFNRSIFTYFITCKAMYNNIIYRYRIIKVKHMEQLCTADSAVYTVMEISDHTVGSFNTMRFLHISTLALSALCEWCKELLECLGSIMFSPPNITEHPLFTSKHSDPFIFTLFCWVKMASARSRKFVCRRNFGQNMPWYTILTDQVMCWVTVMTTIMLTMKNIVIWAWDWKKNVWLVTQKRGSTSNEATMIKVTFMQLGGRGGLVTWQKTLFKI
jgi:hypothetical protein